MLGLGGPESFGAAVALPKSCFLCTVFWNDWVSIITFTFAGSSIMKTWKATEFGSPREVLRCIDAPIPSLEDQSTDDLIQVRVLTAGVGLPDVIMLTGQYPPVKQAPVSPGQELVGIVTETSAGSSFKVGDKLMGISAFSIGHGGFSEMALLIESRANLVPSSLTDEQAAGFIIPYHTAHNALEQRTRLKPGETLLVLGAPGSSGSAAVQLGKAMGAHVIAVAGNEEKANFCRTLGADEVINYRQGSVSEQVMNVTQGKGADVIFDPVGGDSYRQATRCVAHNGRIALVGFAAGWPKIDPRHILQHSYDLVGVFIGARSDKEVEEAQRTLFDLCEKGLIVPPIDQVFDFEDVPKALERLASGNALGKQIVKISE